MASHLRDRRSVPFDSIYYSLAGFALAEDDPTGVYIM